MATATQALVIAGLGPTVLTTGVLTVTGRPGCLFARSGANDNAPRAIPVSLLRRLCAARTGTAG